MNALTKLSAKGQVVIPKATRDRLGLRPGQSLEVVETAGGVLLKRVPSKGLVSLDEAVRRIRSIVRYEGPPVTIEEMNETIRQGWIDAALRSNCARD
ncbi:MAG TPA: AbrB/MazE/SpoVT family DNA-binding domain-containing protein [Allosphingosinicella sp.]|jgi:AbrB family looped-hinge helix DNA binding protein